AQQEADESEVDLSGQHLEHLPISLFSNLKLTRIYLSHNLLTSNPPPALKRRPTHRYRKRRERRPRKASNSTRKDNDVAEDPVNEDNESPHVDSSETIEDESTKKSEISAEIDFNNKESNININEESEGCPQWSKVSPPDGKEWSSVAEELEARLHSRRLQCDQEANDLLSQLEDVNFRSQNEIDVNNINTNSLNSTDQELHYSEVLAQTVKNINFNPGESNDFDIDSLHSDSQKENHTTNNVSEIKTLKREGHKPSRKVVRRRSSAGVTFESSSSSSETEEIDSGTGEPEKEGLLAQATSGLGSLSHLNHFKQLEVLVISWNTLEEFPSSLVTLPLLKRLSLNNNRIITLPDSIANMTSMEELDVSYNRIQRLGPGVGKLPRIKKLFTSWNKIDSIDQLA
ncbi:unnamed protein product, partial [Meganyctiphanes norvegica]